MRTEADRCVCTVMPSKGNIGIAPMKTGVAETRQPTEKQMTTQQKPETQDAKRNRQRTLPTICSGRGEASKDCQSIIVPEDREQR